MTFPLNSDRSSWAAGALATHAEITGNGGEDEATQLSDLLANLRHWAVANGVDFEDTCEGSRNVFDEETEEERQEIAQRVPGAYGPCF